MDWNAYLKIHTMITWIYFASLCKIRDVYKCSVFKAETIIIGERFFIIINEIADDSEDVDEENRIRTEFEFNNNWAY